MITSFHYYPGNMATRKQSLKRSAQNLNISMTKTPTKPVQSNISKPKDTMESEDEKETDVKEMFEIIMGKLSKLDDIDSRVKSIENDLKNMKDSVEFVHAEVKDLKKENESRKAGEKIMDERVKKLEELNTTLRNRVIDLQARSMRDNLIFYNIKELKNENVTDVIHNVLENQLELENAKSLVKIDRTHRLGKQDPRAARPRAIVCKLNYYPDKERILANTRKLKGSGIAISEQFPEEILKVRKRLYPILKKAKQEKKRVKMVRDKLFIEGQLYVEPNTE